jgi:hypothetical protein
MKRSLLVWFACSLLVCLPCGEPARGCDSQPEACAAATAVGDEWPEERRRGNPEGYFAFVCQKLDQEAKELMPACDSLKADIGRQNEAIQAKLDLWHKAKEVAETFRGHYQRAKEAGLFPVEVCGVFYCEEQLLSQVSMLMEEAKGLAECVTKMKAARERAEAKLEELNVRKTRVDSQRSIAASLFELWKVSHLRSDGERMLASLEQLIANEPLQLARCTSRTSDGFPAIPNGRPRPHRNLNPVECYLQYTATTNGTTAAPQSQESRTSATETKAKAMFAQE